MTALDLCNDMAAERFKQFGSDNPAEVLPSKYFNYSVQVIAPDGTPTQRNPRYCATALGAKQLAELLRASSVVMGNAVNFTGLLDSWNDTELVPYLMFSDGVAQSKPVNAGLLLDYFNHTSTPATELEASQALAKAAFEVKGAF